MIPVIIHLRAMQMYAHHAHNLCARVVFFQDHDAFGAFYSEYEGDYDDVVERQIGLAGDGGLELSAILSGVAQKLSGKPTVGVKENAIYFATLLTMEQELCSTIKPLLPSVSEGTRQLLGEICNKSEKRQYKIKQRLKK